MELNNLEFSGVGLIHDSETGVEEEISVHAPLDLAQLILTLDTVV